MKISTQQLFNQSLSAMLNQQSDLTRIQNQIARSTRLLSPSDDPIATAQVMVLDQTVQATAQYQRNGDAATGRLELEETTLSTASNSLQRIRELVVQAKTTANGAAERNFIASEISERLEELAGLANTRDAHGDYLFAGYQTRTQPYARNAAGQYTYAGDAGQRLLQIGPDRQIADSDTGQYVFEQVRNGNGSFVSTPATTNTGTGVIDGGEVTNPAAFLAHNYRIVFTSATSYDVVDDTLAVNVATAQPYTNNGTIAFDGMSMRIQGTPAAGDVFAVAPSANQSIFTTVERLVTALRTPISSPAQQAAYQHATNRALLDLDQGVEKLLEVRTGVGARLKAIDAQKQVNDDLGNQLVSVRSKLSDLDITEASVRLNQELVALQAAQQAFVRTSSLSLFALL